MQDEFAFYILPDVEVYEYLDLLDCCHLSKRVGEVKDTVFSAKVCRLSARHRVFFNVCRNSHHEIAVANC